MQTEPLEPSLLEPRDAEGVVALFREVYEDHYPIKSMYDPQELIRRNESGEASRAVIRTGGGEVVGHVAFYRSSPPNRDLYECGQMMVRHDHRGLGLEMKLAAFAVGEMPRLLGIRHMWGEAVCNHLVTQRMSIEGGYTETGVEVGLMTGESFAMALKELSTDTERVSALLVFRSDERRARTLYLPAVYDDILRYVYEPWSDETTFTVSTQPLPRGIKTHSSVENFGGSGTSRITVDVLGEDFEERLARMEAECSTAGAVLVQVIFRLTEPASGAAADILRRRGFFFGGALPRWFGEDGMLMQRVKWIPDFSKIFLGSRRARQIGECIRQDWEKTRLKTLGDLARRRGSDHGDRPAIICPARGLRMTYAELDRESDRVAAALTALGMERGEHAAIWAANVPEYAAITIGCSKAGIPLLLLNISYRAYELEYALKKSDIKCLFLTEGTLHPGEYVGILQEVRPRLPKLRHAVILGDMAYPGLLGWDAFLRMSGGAGEEGVANRATAESGDDVLFIQYTSGTTGLPKGVLVSHYAYLNTVQAWMERQGTHSADILCLPLPLFHVYGMGALLCMLVAGGASVVLERFNPTEMLRAMESEQTTIVSGAPTMFAAALAELDKRTYNLSKMRGGNIGGAVCPPELFRQVADRMHAPELGLLYGCTEGLLGLLGSPLLPLEKRMRAVGPALPETAVRIADRRTGETLGPGQEGELCLKGPYVMRGYYRMEEASVNAFDAGGWLRTGDLACADEEGLYRITGRIKDMIIRGGENIYPAEIEDFLATHPKVRDAQVVGVPCTYYGEEPVAFLRLKPGETAGVVEMKSYCRQAIAIHKVPAYFFFVNEYPLTASGKVQKFRLREMAAELLADKDSTTK